MTQDRYIFRRKEFVQQVREYIFDCIDSEAYDFKTTTEKEKLQFLSDTFKSEYGWAIRRYGQGKAFEEWIKGLPTVFGIEFTNYEIIQLAKKWGSLPENATEKQEDKIIENYWRFITSHVFQLFRKYNIH